MARDLEQQVNVEAPSADYPNGRIKDNSGIGDGTFVDELVYGDFHQFFAKLMRDANVTPNNLPDNTSNTFQLNEALKKTDSDNMFKANGIFDEYVGAEDFGSGVLTSPTDIFVINNKAYITDDVDDIVYVFDITDGSHLSGEDFGNTELLAPTSIFIVGDRAYITDNGANKVFVYEVSTGDNKPAEEFGGATIIDPTGLFIVGDRAYVSDVFNDEVNVFEVSTQTAKPAEDFGFGVITSPTSVFVIPEFDMGYVTDFIDDIVYVFRLSTQNADTNNYFGTGATTEPLDLFMIGRKAYVLQSSECKTHDFFTLSNTFADKLRNEDLNLSQASSTDAVSLFIYKLKCYILDATNDEVHVFKQNLLIDYI